MEKRKQEKSQEKKKMGLTTRIFIALLLGGITGLCIHYFLPDGSLKNDILKDGIFYLIGNGFLRLMQMLVVPLVFCSLVCGSSAMGDSKSLGKVGIKTIGFYLFTTALAVITALLVGSLIRPGIGVDLTAVEKSEVAIGEAEGLADTLLNIIPKNPFQGLAEGNMLQVILFALIVGIILAKLGERVNVVSNFFSQFNEIMMEMTSMVMLLAPFGVFCMIARTFIDIGFDGFLPMLKYMFSVILALGVQCFIIYMLLLKVFTGLNPLKFIKKFLPVMGFAFSTATSNATIPLSIETLEEKIGVSRRVSSFTIPLGATINMDGTSIMQGVAAVFVSQVYNIPLSLTAYATIIATATLASIGTAGVPGVGLVTLSMVFASVGLPVEGIALIMGIDRILDMARTAVNVTGDAVCTTIVAVQNKDFDKEVFNQKGIKES